MADTYVVLGATGTTLLGVAAKPVPGRLVSIRTKATGAMGTLAIGAEAFEPAALGLELTQFAAALDKAMNVTGVTDVNVYQDVGNAGQFIAKLDVSVVSTSGNSDDTIHPPYGSLYDARFAAAVHKAVANLDATEAL